MTNYNHYKEIIKTSNAKIAYYNKRVRGVKAAIKQANNKALLSALNTELQELLKDIKTHERRVSDAKHALREIERNSG